MTVPSDGRAVETHGYLEVMALVILYYDHILTLTTEISEIWPRFRSRSRSALLFFLNRYIPFFGNIAVSAFSFTNLASTEQSCRAYGLARQLLLLCNQVVVSVLLALRIIALYNHSRRVNILVLGSGITLFGLACWSLVGQHSSVIQDVVGCHISMTLDTGIHIAVAWEAQAVFDLLIFGLTIYRTLQTRRFVGGRRRRFPTPSGGGGLVDLMFRDGAVYFIVMALANVSNILTFYFASPALKGVLSTFASCISITMMSRLMLNLHEATSSPMATTGTTGAISVHMVFASQINMPSQTQSDDDDGRHCVPREPQLEGEAILPPAFAAHPHRSRRSAQISFGDVELESVHFSRGEAESRLP